MMMSMIKRIFALLLTVAMLICVLVACGKPQNTTQFNNAPQKNATTYAKNATDPSPLEQKITSVNITCGDSVIENYAAAELAWYLGKKNISITSDGYEIAFLLDSSLPAGGYQITANTNGLAVAGGNERGLAYGLYAFLEKFLGVYIYFSNTIVVNDSDLVVGTGVLDSFDPAFDVLRNPWYPIEQLAEKNGGNIRDRGEIKNFSLNSILGNGSDVPCFSDPDNVAKAIKIVQDYLLSGAKVDILCFSPDSETDLSCSCEACTQIMQEEGSYAGVYARFLNAVAEKFATRFPNLKIELVVRAYLKTAPTLTKLAPNVSVYFNTSQCHISHPLTDENCPDSLAFAQSVRGWSAVCENVYVEYGVTATTDYIPTFANLGTLRENIRFFAECGIGSLTLTGNFMSPSGEFGELRVYLISNLLQNPYMSEEKYNAYMNSFLEAFYGDGWEYVRMYIDKTVELAADGHQLANGNPFDAITTEEYLANEADFDAWWNTAEELAGDRIDFVKRSRYQWRYIKLCLHPDAEEAQKLIADASDSFNTRVGWREKQWNVDIAKSDLTKSPLEWVYKS